MFRALFPTAIDFFLLSQGTSNSLVPTIICMQRCFLNLIIAILRSTRSLSDCFWPSKCGVTSHQRGFSNVSLENPFFVGCSRVWKLILRRINGVNNIFNKYSQLLPDLLDILQSIPTPFWPLFPTYPTRKHAWCLYPVTVWCHHPGTFLS